MNRIMHVSEAEDLWDKKRHPNFAAREFACPCCGEFYWDSDYFDMAQKIRTLLGRSVKFNSAHRCGIHNARVGGAPKSQHKKIALDFSLTSPAVTAEELPRIYDIMVSAGARTFGLYRTFIHIDQRVGRFWICPGGDKWEAYFRRYK